MTRTLPTRNEAWGYFGTMRMAGADPVLAWNAASAMIAAETNASPEAVREFLDSRHGRHFAEDVRNKLAEAGPAMHGEAIEASIAHWQGWRIGRATSRETGIPRGLPYLTGFVAHFEIMEEAVA